MAGFIQPGKKEPHIEAPAAQVATQRRIRDGLKVYATVVKINFSQFAAQHFFLSQSKNFAA